MVQVNVHNSIDQALRALKRKIQREGVFRILKLKRYYEKPCEIKMRKLNESIRRKRKLRKRKDD